MNGLYSNYMGFPSAPRQNVQQYVNAPVMSVPAQTQQPQVTMADFLRATQPKQENFFNTTDANPLLHVAGLPLNQQQQTQPSQNELIIQRISGYNGNTSL